MKLTNDHEKFTEIVREYDAYGTLHLKRDGIPVGCNMSISWRGGEDEQLRVTVFRTYPFNETVKSARKDMIAHSNMCSGSAPTVRFAIEGWTPEKLADMQTKTAERAAKYAELTRKYHEATKVYNAALEAP
jgi:hypothetical protein